MTLHKGFSTDKGYCLIHPFSLNTAEHTLLGEPETLPADSFLIDYYFGDTNKRVLIDTGKKGQGKDVIIPYLKQHHIQTIDYLFISHMHRDHYGGLIDLLHDPTIRIKQIIYAPIPKDVIQFKNPGAFSTWEELEGLLQQNKNLVTEVYEEGEESRFSIDKDFYLEIIATPNRRKIAVDQTQASINDLNMVLKMHYKKFTALFPGDCGVEQADEILHSEKKHAIENVFLLKAPHHGKSKRLSQEFITACNARLVIVPCNEKVTNNKDIFMSNIYDYSQSGAKIYRMDHYEEIHVYTDGSKVKSIGKTNHFSERAIFDL